MYYFRGQGNSEPCSLIKDKEGKTPYLKVSVYKYQNTQTAKLLVTSFTKCIGTAYVTTESK